MSVAGGTVVVVVVVVEDVVVGAVVAVAVSVVVEDVVFRGRAIVDRSKPGGALAGFRFEVLAVFFDSEEAVTNTDGVEADGTVAEGSSSCSTALGNL